MDEKEEFVGDHRAACRQPRPVFVPVGKPGRRRPVPHPVTAADQMPVVSEAVNGAVEVVRPRPGDRIDGASRKSRLADIERSDADLKLLDGLHRDGLRAGLPPVEAVVGQSVCVVVDDPVDAEAVVAVVDAVETDGPVGGDPHMGVQADGIGNPVGDGGHTADLGGGHARSGSGPGVFDSAPARHDDFAELQGGLFQDGIVPERFTQPQGDASGPVIDHPEAGDLDPVRAARAHSPDHIAPVRIRGGGVPGAGRFMDGCDGRADHRSPLRIGHFAPDRRRGDLRMQRDGHREEKRSEQESFF